MRIEHETSLFLEFTQSYSRIVNESSPVDCVHDYLPLPADHVGTYTYFDG